ncbi:MAG: dTMP kinase [Limosilactobacillus sp.]|nr:dTMP kinase [Limosilactobacillus sp.]
MGKFISFEGLDGSGKTSVMQAIQARLVERLGADKIVMTREPGGTPLGEMIREVLLADAAKTMDPVTEALLFAASRRQHVVEKIQPALAKQQWVLSDRFLDSSLAYQGGGRQLGVETVQAINAVAVNDCLPDLTIFLDVPRTAGLERIQKHRQNQVNRLDQEQADFYERVRETFLTLAQENPARLVVVDATQPLAEVVAAVWQVIETRL